MRRAVYAVVAVAAAGVGFGLYRFVIEPRLIAPAQVTAVPVTTAPVAAGEPAAEEPVLTTPDTLPEFALRDRDGQLKGINTWADKSMIVNFWATWCGPCRREIPLLKQLHTDQAAKGFQVVGVAVDDREAVIEYAEQIDINYPLLIGEQDGMDAVMKFGLGSVGFPFTAFTDKQHRIVTVHQGELNKGQADAMLAVIDQLNRGELTLEAARDKADERLAALVDDKPKT